MIIIDKQKAELLIVANKLLRFDYVAADLEVTRGRIAMPIKIIRDDKEEPVAIQAYDFTKKDFRQFRFEGIQKLELITIDQAFSKTAINI